MKEQRYIMNVDYYEPLNLWQENHIYPSDNGVSVFIRDISIRKRTEDEMLQMNKNLRELSSHLQNVREQERIHIEQAELDDELGQQLTGLKNGYLTGSVKNLLKPMETIKTKLMM